MAVRGDSDGESDHLGTANLRFVGYLVTFYFNLSDHEIDLRIPEGYEILLSSKPKILIHLVTLLRS